MRDPELSVVFEGQLVRRTFRNPLAPDHPLRNPLLTELQKSGRITPFEISGEAEALSPRLSWVTYPSEWCDSQLYRAAQHTLQLSSQLATQNIELKDASSFNVIFSGTIPVFCDLGSFRKTNRQAWDGANQFLRHFIFPLWVAKFTGMPSAFFFRHDLNGCSHHLASSLLGYRKYFSRCLPLLWSRYDLPLNVTNGKYSSVARLNLIEGLATFLESIKPSVSRIKSDWINYVKERAHYSNAGALHKRKTFQEYLRFINASSAIDLGCNTGEFVELALQYGCSVAAIDSDHASLESLFLRVFGEKKATVVFSAIDDMHNGRGFGGREYMPFKSRFGDSADVLIAQGLLHHLFFAAALKSIEISNLLRNFGTRYLIVELIGEEDPMLRLVAGRFNRAVSEFSSMHQLECIEKAGFVVCRCTKIDGTCRELLLCEKKVTT